ncbi:ena/VASP-like protein [Micropterus salmoides]|uniref:ena/VASP-like protein n=1 Tax=Micropterus salmoides TaxID=27706 RepID=UPI0018EAA2AB|nr:ena/VASP-like protein [Micropterus salmoides]
MLYCHLFLPATVGGKCHMLSDHGSVMLHSAACFAFYDILILSYLLLASVFGLLLIFSSLLAWLLSWLLFILLTFFSFLFSFVCCPPSSSSSYASPLSFCPLSVFLSLPVTVVSTLQYKVSTPPTHPDTPPEYRQYRASTLPPSYVRVASSSPPSSASSSPSQEKEAGAARDKAQLSSQLSTSLASAFSPVQAGVTTQGRQVRQIPLSPPTAARHLHLQQQLQQQDIMLPPKHGTWSASHLQQMYAQLPPSSSPPVMMAMPVKQGLPSQPVLPMAHPLPPLSTRMKPPPLDPSSMTGPHQYPQHQPHPHSNGQPDNSYSPHSQHLPLTPQYCEAVPMPPLIGQIAPGPAPSHQPQYASTFHPQQQQHLQQQQHQQLFYQQAQPPTTTTSSSSPPSYTAMSDGGSPKKTPSPVPQQAPMVSSSKYEEERGGGSLSTEGCYMCTVCVCMCLCLTHSATQEP